MKIKTYKIVFIDENGNEDSIKFLGHRIESFYDLGDYQDVEATGSHVCPKDCEGEIEGWKRNS